MKKFRIGPKLVLYDFLIVLDGLEKIPRRSTLEFKAFTSSWSSFPLWPSESKFEKSQKFEFRSKYAIVPQFPLLV